MRDLKNNLTSGKNTSNIQSRKGKSFGYQVLGFGAGGSLPDYDIDFLVVGGGGGGGKGVNASYREGGGGGGAGGYRTSTETDRDVGVYPHLTLTTACSGEQAAGRIA